MVNAMGSRRTMGSQRGLRPTVIRWCIPRGKCSDEVFHGIIDTPLHVLCHPVVYLTGWAWHKCSQGICIPMAYWDPWYVARNTPQHIPLETLSRGTSHGLPLCIPWDILRDCWDFVARPMPYLVDFYTGYPMGPWLPWDLSLDKLGVIAME